MTNYPGTIKTLEDGRKWNGLAYVHDEPVNGCNCGSCESYFPQQVERLYQAAVSADDKFQSALEKQFGKRNAGHMRYRSSIHNAETVSAREKYFAATARWKDALDEMRTTGVK